MCACEGDVRAERGPGVCLLLTSQLPESVMGFAFMKVMSHWHATTLVSCKYMTSVRALLWWQGRAEVNPGAPDRSIAQRSRGWEQAWIC